MRAAYVLIVALMLTYVCVEPQSPVFLVHPVYIAAIDGTTVEFSCTAENADGIRYSVNGSSAASSSITSKGFTQGGIEELGIEILRRNLTVTVSSLYNNTEIFCRAEGSLMNVDSEVAYLTVQGPLSSAGDLSSSFINSSTIHISWSPPFTLPGTAITGYNISVTNNGTNTNYFTSHNYYVLWLSDITDSPCNEINIIVSGYNGLNGETESISVPSSDVVVPISVDISEVLQLTVTINVTSACIDEHPTNVDIILFQNGTEVNQTDVVFPDDPKNGTLTVVDIYAVVEDKTYTITTSFSIFDGGLDVSSRHIFNTFGVQSIDVNDTPKDSVAFSCTFHSFSTDTGCTVQLMLSGIVQYTANFSRSGNTATGNISGVATGLYLVHVFDQGNPTVVLTSDLMVIGEPTTTTIATSITSSMGIITTTVPDASLMTTTTNTTTFMSMVTSPINPNTAEDSQTTMIYIAIAVPIGAVIIILLPIVLTLVVCVVRWKNNRTRSESSNSVELIKQVSNVQANETVRPDRTVESEFHNDMDNCQEADESGTPSPRNDQPPPIPNGHQSSVAQNNQHPAEDKDFTDDSIHPELGEPTSDKGQQYRNNDDNSNGRHAMNTPTAAYIWQREYYAHHCNTFPNCQ